MNGISFLNLLIVWLLCMALVLWGRRREGSGAGLVIAYVLQLWLIHWLGASIYALPWYKTPDEATMLGLQQSTYAIGAFALGSTVLFPVFLKRSFSLRGLSPTLADPRLMRVCLIIGLGTYFVFEPILHSIPTIGAIASATSNLLLVALAMECWNGLQSGGARKSPLWRWILLSAAFPFVTIVTKGFLGYGFSSMLTVLAFVASFYRPRWKLIAGSALIGYLALSLYVTYMRDRSQIREVVWGQEAYSSRLSRTMLTFTDFEFLDLTNYDHLSRIDDRLNQNSLLGYSVEYLSTRPWLFANGSTIGQAILSAIPRALWPDKPMVAGSGDMVSDFTGLHFGEDTSVGIGHIMEWYVNFGSLGVLFGMTGMGMLVAWMDRSAALHLYRGDWTGFMLWWLPGLSLLQVGGSFVEAVSGAGAGLVIAILLRQLTSHQGWLTQSPPEILTEGYGRNARLSR